MLELTINRDSVHAGDDMQSHATQIRVPDDCRLSQFLNRIRAEGYLPSISGGRATWIVRSVRPLAVIAQEWNAPATIESTDARIADLMGQDDHSIYFEYLCQSNPGVVYKCLKTGQPIPTRYSR